MTATNERRDRNLDQARAFTERGFEAARQSKHNTAADSFLSAARYYIDAAAFAEEDDDKRVDFQLAAERTHWANHALLDHQRALGWVR